MQHNIDKGQVKAEIAFVFCNRERGYTEETDKFLALVDSYGIPLVCFSSKKFRAQRGPDTPGNWRIEYDRQAMALLQDFNPDICVLAGYMLVVGEEMCRHYDMVILHPAAPGGPAGTWREVIWELIRSNAAESGVMMHLAIPELDKGPPVTYCTFPIRGEPFDRYWEEIRGLPVDELIAQQGDDNPLFRLIRKEGVKREQPLIVATVKAFSEGSVSITDGNVVDSRGNPIEAYSLTREINEMVKDIPIA
jgi:folate-dependent phosphoribosylglycinamide formyltransferase PurN